MEKCPVAIVQGWMFEKCLATTRRFSQGIFVGEMHGGYQEFQSKDLF
jgi:hypothetical protein